MKAIRRINVRTVLPDSISALGELATNLRWSWHEPSRALFESIDPRRWQSVQHDPVALLAALSAQELARLAGDQDFVDRVVAAGADLHQYLTSPRWFQSWAVGERTRSGRAPESIAYFSPEFGITAVLPQYSGGLGILAGDHLKTGSDLGVPFVGVGLFYKTGYFKQSLDASGWQQETYPVLDPDDLPLSLMRDPDGEASMISIDMPGDRVLHAHVLKAQVGRVPLLLLDSDVEQNDQALRSLTDRLYGGGGEERLQQEILLGVGGVRALRLWSRLTGAPEPDVYHTNEGHAGFQGVERIRELTQDHHLEFDQALEVVRASTVFTTHTPVPAGIDRFGADQIQSYFGGDLAAPGVPIERLLGLGAESYAGGDPSVFNMAVMGLRLAQRANGVSSLHGEVSRHMFDGLWPGFDDAEVPITSITNGVHAPTWVDPKVVALAEKYVGTAEINTGAGWDRLMDIPGKEIWATKRELREQLVQDARRRVRSSCIQRGSSPAELRWLENILDPDVLTIGFARRVPTYKRLTLMLRDEKRLKALLLDPDRPIQLVIAGKSHPADETGKKLIQQMVRFADDPEVRRRIVFLPNYDIAMAQVLYPGCDVWLNNPLRPFEACGTSGMKAALNGGLNLSILDGWWEEWFDGQNGWAIPTADGVEDAERRDDLEAAALYELLEVSVVPRYYDRDAEGTPTRWVSMITHTLRTLGPKVVATRMVSDYVRRLYAPAARSGWAMGGSDFAGGKDLAAYKDRVRHAWHGVELDHVDSYGVKDVVEVGDSFEVRAYIDLGDLTPEDVEVQVVSGRASASDELSDLAIAPLWSVENQESGRYCFGGDVVLTRSGTLGYTVRVLPRHRGLASAAELGLVTNA